MSLLRSMRIILGAAAALAPLAAETSPGGVSALLETTARSAEQLWDQFSSLACLETVTQTKLNPDRKVISEKRESYQYLLLLQLSGDRMTVEETRELQGPPARQTAKPLLKSGGFSVLALIFHPFYQSSYLFREADSPRAGERVIEFQAVRGARSPSALELKGREYPIEWRGTAVIDRASGHIRRIQAGLPAPLDDLGLQELTAEVVYGPVSVGRTPGQVWLPQSAVVEARTQRQHWRNLHQFSGYKRFSVSSEVSVGDVH
jgi:hypothetical protein